MKIIKNIESYRLKLAHSLLNIRKQETRQVGDYSKLICCPVCKANLQRANGDYSCTVHGSYKIDDENRPLLIEGKVFEKNTDQHVSGINWLKSFFKQFPKVYYLIWHVVCPVMMLINGPRMVLELVPKNGKTIDVGSGPERLGPEFINVDVFPFPEVDIVANAEELPFRDNSIDAAVSESVFEHVPDAWKVAREMVRVVKPGGYIYVSAPFVHPYHASPDDFNRWTISGLKHMFPELEIVKSGVRSGPWSAFLMFMAYWLGVIFCFGYKKAAPFLAHIFMLVLGPIKYLDYFFSKMPGAEAVSAHLYILGKKK
jgi:SAM-dependent methyltransferase